jgi:hypothetical protein
VPPGASLLAASSGPSGRFFSFDRLRVKTARGRAAVLGRQSCARTECEAKAPTFGAAKLRVGGLRRTREVAERTRRTA